MSKAALITGATGCVGRNLVDELKKEKWQIYVLHRPSSDLSRLRGCNFVPIKGNLHDLASLERVIPDGLDAVFHVAGNTSHWKKDYTTQWKDNVLATRNLISIAKTKKVKRFIFTSTCATYRYQGMDESMANQYIESGYVRTKRLSEIEVERALDLGLDAVVLQPIIVIGPYDYNNYSEIFTGISEGKFKAALPGRLVFCHAGDVARAHVMAFERGRTGQNYILSGTHTTWLDVFQRIAKRVGTKSITHTLPKSLLLLISQFMELTSMVTQKKPTITPELIRLLEDSGDAPYWEKRKAKEDLQYESRPLDVMIDDCYQWLLSEGKLTGSPKFRQFAI